MKASMCESITLLCNSGHQFWMPMAGVIHCNPSSEIDKSLSVYIPKLRILRAFSRICPASPTPLATAFSRRIFNSAVFDTILSFAHKTAIALLNISSKLFFMLEQIILVVIELSKGDRYG